MWPSRKRRKLEEQRQEVLDNISYERWQFELMAQRAQLAGEPPSPDFVNTVLARFTELDAQANAAKTVDEFDHYIEKAEEQGTLRAYICPAKEVVSEGSLAIDVMTEWSIPKTIIDGLRNSLGTKLRDADIAVARGALRAIFQENTSWATYTDDYEQEMQKYTYWLVGVTIVLLAVIPFGIHFRLKASSTVFLAVLICAGAAGSCVSVMRKMPLFDISLSGELDAYVRRILSRVATGTVASLVGCAFLSWGVLPISMQGITFPDVVKECTAQDASSCTISKILIITAVAILLGFSERTLTSLEQRVLGGESENS